MPPPRLIRPLRPYPPQWSSPQVRWASDRPRDQLAAHHDDPAQASNSARESHDRGLDHEIPNQTKQSGWLQSVVGRASGWFNQPSATHKYQTSTPRPHNLDPAETTEDRPRASATQPPQTQADVGPQETLPAREQQPSMAKLDSLENATTPKSLTCDVCQTNFVSAKRLKQHVLWSDRCLQESAYKRRYACNHCYLDFSTPEDARRHFAKRRKCLDRISEWKIPVDSEFTQVPHLKRLQWVIRAAERRHHRMDRALSDAVVGLKAISPTARLLSEKSEITRDAKADSSEITVKADSSKTKGKTDSSKATAKADEFRTTKKVDSSETMAKANVFRTIAKVDGSKMTGKAGSSRIKDKMNGPKTTAKADGPRQTEQGSITPSSQSEAAPKIPVNVRIRESQSPKQRASSKDQVASSDTTRGKSKRSLTQFASDLGLDQPSGHEEPMSSRNIRSVSSESQDRKTVELGQSAEILPDLVLQVQQLAEQVRNLTERLSASEALAKVVPQKHVSAPTVPTKATESGPGRVREIKPSASTPAEEELTSTLEDESLQNDTDYVQLPPLDRTELSYSGSETQRLTRQMHTQARLMRSSGNADVDHAKAGEEKTSSQAPSQPSKPSAVETTSLSNEISERPLWDELFPESSSYIQPHYTKRNPYPKLDLPSSPVPLIKREVYESKQDKLISSEAITALQLVHCSTELVEADFRRLIPKGKHIDGWARGGEFLKVIPGRDPLSLARLPFYYILFKSPAAALEYQKNAGRLHKLNRMHQPSSIMSPIPPPKGFLEEGEDIGLATSLFQLVPNGAPLNLNMVMQPYDANLQAIIKLGGYKPLVPSTSASGKPVFKVLMHIEGYEPSQKDLYQLLSQEGHARGIQWPFHNEVAGVQRLRDITRLHDMLLRVPSANPPAVNPERHRSTEDDPSLSFLDVSSEEGSSAAQTNQMIVNRVYNRWIIEFDDEEAAKRFARLWNRRTLPVSRSEKHVTWRDREERRVCNTEYVW